MHKLVVSNPPSVITKDRKASSGAARLIRLCFWLALLLVTHPRQVVAREEPPDTEHQQWPVIIAQLREQANQMPGHAAVRRQLAIAYNNYAVSLADQGRLDEATQQLEEAIRIEPSNTQFQANLVRIYLQTAQEAYQDHQIRQAIEAAEHALSLDPDAVDAYVLLGEVEYLSQHLKEAKTAWQKALTLDPNRKDIIERLDRLSKELPVESGFEKLSQAYFDIRYTEALERAAGFDIRDALLQARREIGSDFTHWPTHKLIVLVYSAEQFRRLRQDTPDWVAGQYDGKIRVPLPGHELDRNAVTRILFHEYTHALVHDLTDNRCPTWFNEGLAEYESWKRHDPPWLMLRDAIVNERLIPWADLSMKFSTASSAHEVALAYEQSHSIVRYLVHRYGFWRIRRLLKAVANGTPLETALSTELHTKLPRLESDWRKWLEEAISRSPGSRR